MAHAAYTFYLWFKENEDRSGTRELAKKLELQSELAKKSNAYASLLSARNALEKQGMNVSVFDATIEKTEEFLRQ